MYILNEEEYLEEEKKELGIKVEDEITVIEYFNGTLTEDGFQRGYVRQESEEDMYHWDNNDKSVKIEDINDFLDLVINSKYLSDGLLWGIALNTWPVISLQLQEAKLSTPIVFFIGAPGTLKTSVARMFITTGTYKNDLFAPFEIPAFMSAAKFKKQIQGIKSSLVLMDDLHEVKGYSSKDRMQNNIDTICREFYDYRNDSSLLITAEKNVNLKFTESFLQRVVLVNFPSMIHDDIDEKERYFKYIDSKSDRMLNILTNYQAYLLKSINNGRITADSIKKKRKAKRTESYNDSATKTARQSDIQTIFEFSISQFNRFCRKNKVSKETLDLLSRKIEDTKKRTIFSPNFYAMTFEEKIYHCLKFIGLRDNFLVSKAEKGMVCVNFDFINEEGCACFEHNDKPINILDDTDYNKAKEENNARWFLNYYIGDKKNGCPYHCFELKSISHTCYLSIHNHKYCANAEIEERYWPTSLYLDRVLKRKAILIDDWNKIPFLDYFSQEKHDSFLIVNAKEFINAIQDIYYDLCEKYNLEQISIKRNQILNALKELGIIGYKKIPYFKKNSDDTYRKDLYIFDFPGDKAYILKLPDEIYKAISSNMEKTVDSRIIEKDMDAFSKFNKARDIKLYELFHNFEEIKFRPIT